MKTYLNTIDLKSRVVIPTQYAKHLQTQELILVHDNRYLDFNFNYLYISPNTADYEDETYLIIRKINLDKQSRITLSTQELMWLDTQKQQQLAILKEKNKILILNKKSLEKILNQQIEKFKSSRKL